MSKAMWKNKTVAASEIEYVKKLYTIRQKTRAGRLEIRSIKKREIEKGEGELSLSLSPSPSPSLPHIISKHESPSLDDKLVALLVLDDGCSEPGCTAGLTRRVHRSRAELLHPPGRITS